jgi:hypothetical protein
VVNAVSLNRSPNVVDVLPVITRSLAHRDESSRLKRADRGTDFTNAHSGDITDASHSRIGSILVRPATKVTENPKLVWIQTGVIDR